MLLCIDIGNTNIKLGLFEGERMACQWAELPPTAPVWQMNMPCCYLISLPRSAWISSRSPGCAISSVVQPSPRNLRSYLIAIIKQTPWFSGPKTITGIRINTDYPAEVGSDLVMNALAARHLYGTPVIVIGFGTATTFVAFRPRATSKGWRLLPGLPPAGFSLPCSLHPAAGGVSPSINGHREKYHPILAGRVYFRFCGVGQNW